jgi:hypothetical protein
MIKILTNIKTQILFLSVFLFAISLTQDAISFANESQSHSSLLMLVFGALAILGGGFSEWLIWLANPIYFFSLFLMYQEDKKSIFFAWISFALAFSFSFWKEILNNEAGSMAIISSLNTGYYLWVGSMLVLGIGGLVYFKKT